MKIYSSDLARKLTTEGFKWYEEGKLTDQKLRQYFCNNFIANMVKYSYANKLN